MIEENQKEPEKIIFNLSPRATLINLIIFAILSQVFWALSAFPQIDLNAAVQDINVPWYYDTPLSLLSILMMFSWLEYKFSIVPGEISWRAIRIKYLFGCFGMYFFQSTIKIILLIAYFYY